MVSSREGSPRQTGRSRTARRIVWACLSISSLWGATGCQVDMAGMTLPSGKYMYDDVQYFPPGPDFHWAETQAAAQRARMRAMGIDEKAPDVGPAVPPPPPPGAIDPTQNMPNRATDANEGGVPPVPATPPPAAAPPAAGDAVPPPAGNGDAMPKP